MKFLEFIQSKWFTYGFPMVIFPLIAVLNTTTDLSATIMASIAGVSTIIWLFKTVIDFQINKVK